MKKKVRYCSAVNRDFSETVTYNNPLFPAFVQYETLSCYPGYSAISHWHRDLEFIFIKKGKMTYNVNGELLELTEGNGIMVNSRQLHYGFSPSHEECEFLCILLSPELLQGNAWFYQNYVETVTENSSCPYEYLDGGGWQAAVLERLEHIQRGFGAGTDTPDVYFGLLEDFVHIMKVLYGNMRQDGNAAKDSAGLDALRSMIAYIEGNYAEHITLKGIAASGACCKSRCSLLFKKYLRDTPVTYLTRFRLKKSLPILLDSGESITEIAHRCGFGGASYYCEVFKKYYGVSPLTYRKTGEGGFVYVSRT